MSCVKGFQSKRLTPGRVTLDYSPLNPEQVLTKLKGGVQICKLANGDLTWEDSSGPKCYTLLYTISIGHYTQYATSRQTIAHIQISYGYLYI